ncbi:MAG TPA: efflux RND transporter permease subunit [Gemmatimonadales bacterium]|jgi:multidrug efflux pump subunit AcrB|nr:efflux RND transporter permease subunit [Gemmatimonadales bacterium]
MWMVRLALRQPYTMAVLGLVLLLMGVLAASSMLVDIFPSIDIPVVAVVWTYPGLSAEDMEKRVVLLSERGLSSTVDGIERIESQSTPGIGLLKIYFQPGTNIGNAIAQISSSSSTSLRRMPRGLQPPYIIQSNASNVPVAQLTLSSATLPEEQISDYGQNFIRLRLFTVPGLSTPAPYGGKTREITIDVDPRLLAAKGLSAEDVVTAVGSSNVFIPAGDARMGGREYAIALNSSPSAVSQFARIPLKVVNGTMVTVGDVGHVADGFADQTNIVRVNGRRAAYLTILKKSDASTLAVVEATKELIPRIRAVAPQGLEVNLDFDQSTFVRTAITNVLHEGLIATALVSLMILLFLGSWRSVVVACASIPLAIAAAIIGLKATGNSFNIMTLGGLSLSIGLLVDTATITVENIHRNLAMQKPLTVSLLDGAAQISLPVIIATLAICVVFFPVVLLTGPARFLFMPMSLAVVIAMLAAYALSRTIVPTLGRMLLEHEHDDRPGPVDRFSRGFGRAFERFRAVYGRGLATVVAHRYLALALAALVVVVTGFLLPVIGTDFFPTTDTGLMKLHFRAPAGTRIEQTEVLVAGVEDRIHAIVPPTELQTVNSMIGVPSSLSLAFVHTDNVNGMDAEITVALKPGHHPTADYVRQIRADLLRRFPDCAVYFQTADIVSQVLNFGLSAPIDVEIEYPDLDKSYAMASRLKSAIRAVPGAADVNITQVIDYPTLQVNVDRLRASQAGLSENDVANSMLVSLSSSALIAPTFYINPDNNVNYLVAVKTPMADLASVPALLAMPITPPSGGAIVHTTSTPTDVPGAPATTVGDLATVRSLVTASEISHQTVQRVIDVTTNVEGRDLGSVQTGVQQAIGSLGKLPVGMTITLRGQGEVMQQAFKRLGLGLIIAVLLVYCLMVVMFQSWLDPFIIMVAVPGALVGILWMLAITGTTINVVSLMGSIMAVGIAVSNSILVVSFANDLRVEEGYSAIEAAIEAGRVRLRPVLMTALAMILGMLPMAIGSGEGGEQNAPLGRAVIGGLMVATVATLFVVPAVYAVLRQALPTRHLLEQRFLLESAGHGAANPAHGRVPE